MLVTATSLKPTSSNPIGDQRMFIYYVYAYLKENGTPYYIGKGKNFRAYQSHGNVPVPNNKKYIVFLEKNLSEIGAFALERRYIEWYGRIDLNTGILLNMQKGGTGGTTTKEALIKISKANIGNKNRLGKPQSKEARKKISEAQKGNPKTQEHKEKLRQATLNHYAKLKQKKVEVDSVSTLNFQSAVELCC